MLFFSKKTKNQGKNIIKDPILEDKPEKEKKQHQLPKRKRKENKTTKIPIQYNSKFEKERSQNISLEETLLKNKTKRFKLGYLFLKLHIKDKTFNNKTTIGNLLAGIKFVNWQLKKVLKDTENLSQEDTQDLMALGFRYIKDNNIEIENIKIQTKGKLVKLNPLIKKLSNLTKEEIEAVLNL